MPLSLSEQEVENLARLKEELGSQHNITKFSNPDELAAKVTADLHRWLSDNYLPIRPTFNAFHQLPSPPRDFTGRKDELDELMRALEHGGVTISGLQGQGGVGKTTLALKLAQQLTLRYPDAQLYLDLKGTSKPPLSIADAMAHIIRAYQPAARLPESEAELSALYRSVLHNQRALLLMDNAADRNQVEPLTPPESCVMLVTSRQLFTLPGLFTKNLNTLPADDARDLLLKIAPRINEQADTIARLCGYLPLALRLAASEMADRVDLSVADYVQRLTNAQQRLKLIDASLSLSYELLNPEMQMRWRVLAIFPDTFDATAAAAVWCIELDATQDTLSELVKYSLLEWNEAAARYRLHDLARDFAGARLDAIERERAGSLHAAHYLKIFSTANDYYKAGGVAIAEGLSLFDNERINIEAGQAWVNKRLDNDDESARLCLGFAIKDHHLLSLRLHPKELINWLEAGLRVAQKIGNRHDESNILRNIGLAYQKAGEFRKALPYYEQSLAISRELGDKRGESANLGDMGIAYRRQGEFDKAIDCHTIALALSREISDKKGEAIDLGSLGLVQMDVGQVQSAIEYYQQALTISQDCGDIRNVGIWLGNLGIAYTNLHEAPIAIDYLEQALSVACELNDKGHEGYWLGNLGLVYANLGEVSTAIIYYQQALAIARKVGDKRDEGNALWNMSLAFDKLGKRNEALAHAEAALKIREEIEDPNAAKVRKQLAEWRGQGK